MFYIFLKTVILLCNVLYFSENLYTLCLTSSVVMFRRHRKLLIINDQIFWESILFKLHHKNVNLLHNNNNNNNNRITHAWRFSKLSYLTTIESVWFYLSLKGNEALEKKNSSPRQVNMERKSKFKKKIKTFISGLTNDLNDFLEVKKESSMVENGVFRDAINAVNN